MIRWKIIAAASVSALVAGCSVEKTASSDRDVGRAPDPRLLEQQGEVDPVGSGHAGARKGAGGINGDGDYCDNNNCVTAEGDCDSNAQCGAGSVCLTDNGGRYAGVPGGTLPPRNNQQDDHCAPTTCNDGIPGNTPGETGMDCGGPCGNCNPALVLIPGGAGDGTACELAQHHGQACTYHCACPTGGGDCDFDRDCIGWDDPNVSTRAICVADQGNRFGGPATNDYCLPRHCANGVADNALGETGIDSGGPCGTPNCANPAPGEECTPSCPCTAGNGDCDTTADCAPGLICVEEGATDRCRPAAPPPGAICTNGSNTDCNPPGQTLNPAAAFVDANPPAGYRQCAGFRNLASDDVSFNWEENCRPFREGTLWVRFFDDVNGAIIAGGQVGTPSPANCASAPDGRVYDPIGPAEGMGFYNNPGHNYCGNPQGSFVMQWSGNNTFCGCDSFLGCQDIYTSNAGNTNTFYVGWNANDSEIHMGSGALETCTPLFRSDLRVAIYAPVP